MEVEPEIGNVSSLAPESEPVQLSDEIMQCFGLGKSFKFFVSLLLGPCQFHVAARDSIDNVHNIF